jgi:hypothetical protein
MRSWMLAVPLSIGVPAVVYSENTPDWAAYKATHDTEEHVPLPPELAELSEERTALALQYHQDKSADRFPCCDANWLAANQLPQATWWYCGPAAVSEAIDARQHAGFVSQDELANQLKTTSDSGTAWYGIWVDTSPSTGYPIPDVLNNRIPGNNYLPVALPYSPSGSDVDTFIARLTYDIDIGWPMIGDAWEVPGGPHLVGHPNIEIFHWFEIRGYSERGGQSHYEDSAANAPSLGWSVPPYSQMPSSTIVTILGGRGYVW